MNIEPNKHVTIVNIFVLNNSRDGWCVYEVRMYALIGARLGKS